MGVKAMIIGGFLASFLGAALALQCYQCGMYNDGVGSITPCLNETHMKLIECPRRDHQYCIKYISEGSTVKDCVPKCNERGHLPKLQELYLSFNKLHKFHSILVLGTKKLSELFINNNEITDLSPDFLDGMHQLKVLNMSSNDIEMIKNATFSNINIIELDLSHNKIQYIEDGAFTNLTGLNILDLSYNNVDKLDAAILSKLPANATIHFKKYYTVLR